MPDAPCGMLGGMGNAWCLHVRCVRRIGYFRWNHAVFIVELLLRAVMLRSMFGTEKIKLVLPWHV